MTLGLLSFAPPRLPKRGLALSLALALLLSPGAGLVSAARAQDAGPVAPAAPAPAAPAPPGAGIRIPVAPVEAGPIHTVLLFPFANALPSGAAGSGFNADVVGARLEDAIKMRLNVIGRYKANSFSPTLPQIQRALSEPSATGQGVSENDLVPPYTDASRGQRITEQVGTDGYLLGSVEALSVSPTTRTVSLTVSAALYSTATGGPVKVLAYTGRGVSYNAADDPDALLQSAINDAAGHVVSALNAQSALQARRQQGAFAPDRRQAQAKGRRRNNLGTIVLGVLLAVGVGFGIASLTHHHHGGGGNSTPTTTTTTTVGIPAPPNLGQTTTGTTVTGVLNPPAAPGV